MTTFDDLLIYGDWLEENSIKNKLYKIFLYYLKIRLRKNDNYYLEKSPTDYINKTGNGTGYGWVTNYGNSDGYGYSNGNGKGYNSYYGYGYRGSGYGCGLGIDYIYGNGESI